MHIQFTLHTHTQTHSLLQSCLGSLGGTRVVPDLTIEADCHGNVTIVHNNHRYLLPRGPVRDAEATDVGLERDRKSCEPKPTKNISPHVACSHFIEHCVNINILPNIILRKINVTS